MYIAVILPKNNPFSLLNTKPVVNACLPYVANSKYLSNIFVVTAFTNTPIVSVNNNKINVFVVGEKYSKKNYNYYQEVVNFIINKNITVIEVHQDTKLAAYIAKNTKGVVVCLYKHVDYFINNFKEKFFMVNWVYYHRYIKYINKVYAISNFVNKSLVQKQPKIKNIVYTIYNTYGHLNYNTNNNVTKQNQIIFAGKPVANKGIKYLIPALANILQTHTNYVACLVVANFSAKAKYLKVFNNLINNLQIKQLIDNGRIKIISNVSANEVFKHMQQSKIAVVPSKFKEPFGLVALEASLAKCIVVSSGSGALKEITANNAFYCHKLTVNNLSKEINKAIIYEKENSNGNNLTEMALNNYNSCLNNFNIANLINILDELRLKNFNNNKQINK